MIGQSRPVWVCARRARQVDYPVALGDGGYITDDLRLSFWFCCPSSAPSADPSRLDISRRQCPATFSPFHPRSGNGVRQLLPWTICLVRVPRSLAENRDHNVDGEQWPIRAIAIDIGDASELLYLLVQSNWAFKTLHETKLITGHVAMVFG